MKNGEAIPDRNIQISSHLYNFEGSGIPRTHDQNQITEDSSLLKNSMQLKVSKYKAAFKNRSLTVDFLAILFGIGTWIGVNSTYVQLPLLVETAPESWSLPSYLVVIIQLGNIGPIFYTILQKCFPRRIQDSFMIYGVLVIGTVACLLLAFFYNKTVLFGNQPYSFSLFVLVFFLALIGCTSSVLFMPYMGRFRETYLIMFLIGEGLSGFLPSVVSLVQGVGGNAECRAINSTTGQTFERYVPPPRFDTRVFFLFVFVVMICSSVAFFLLEKLKVCKKQYVPGRIGNGNDYEYDDEPEKMRKDGEAVAVKKLSTKNYRLLLVLMAVVCMFGNGVFPSLQSFSCLPYGNISYHLAVSLSSMANPIACFLAVFLPHTAIRSIVMLIGCGAIFTSYVLATAILSPVPPLVNETIGEILIIFCWTVLVGLVSYIKLCITTVMRSQGGKSLVWVGALGQTGSAIGSIITFVLVNFTNLFITYQPC